MAFTSPSQLNAAIVEGEEEVGTPPKKRVENKGRSYVQRLLKDPKTRALSRDPRLEAAFVKAYAYPSPMREWVLVREMISLAD